LSANQQFGDIFILMEGNVRNIVLILSFVLLPTLSIAQEKPGWAFPRSAADEMAEFPEADPATVYTAPGSQLAVTRKQINDRYNIPNWFPEMYPSLPKVVQYGNKDTEVRACGLCHLPTGTGHDESAYITGLPVNYFIRQMEDYKNGNRVGSGSMIRMAKAMTDEETQAAAEYFASVNPQKWIRVVETDTVPRTYIRGGNKRLLHPDGGSEPIGNRIISVPEDEEIALNRDPRLGFVAMVPPGSIAKGKELATTGGGGKTIACTACHGETLQGMGDVPPIAGRHPTYLVRQLWAMKHGDRKGPSNAIMMPAVQNLTEDDMLAIAAYAASLEP
jgi:cytochrome c553